MKPFTNAPLAEIIAEIHWKPTQGPIGAPFGLVAVQGQQPQVLAAPTSAHELFFSRMTAACASKGFTRSERLIPQGLLVPPNQVVFRYRNPDQPSQFMQIGTTMFSVNAVRPYSSWEEFLPVIRNGLSILDASKTAEIPGSVNEIILRYVDLFDDSHLEGGNAADFIERVAKFGFRLPEPIAKLSSDRKLLDLSLGFKLPLDWGAILVLQLGDGQVLDSTTGEVMRGVAMNTTISIAGDAEFETGTIIEQLDRAHGNIREIFLGITKPIQHLMSAKVEV